MLNGIKFKCSFSIFFYDNKENIHLTCILDYVRVEMMGYLLVQRDHSETASLRGGQHCVLHQRLPEVLRGEPRLYGI